MARSKPYMRYAGRAEQARHAAALADQAEARQARLWRTLKDLSPTEIAELTAKVRAWRQQGTAAAPPRPFGPAWTDI